MHYVYSQKGTGIPLRRSVLNNLGALSSKKVPFSAFFFSYLLFVNNFIFILGEYLCLPLKSGENHA